MKKKWEKEGLWKGKKMDGKKNKEEKRNKDVVIEGGGYVGIVKEVEIK